MLDIRKLNHVYYSQNLLNTFDKCPLKFKIKYLDNIRWKKDSIDDEDYYENMNMGLDFHLIAQRYFSNIPLVINDSNTELLHFAKSLREKFTIIDENIYLPEYEIKMRKDDIRIQAKYDLIIIKPNNKIEIWDWKTENRKLDYSEVSKRMQAIVYMYIVGERSLEIFDREIPFENISMSFWQPQFKEDIITINYSKSKHKVYEEKIIDIIRRLNNYDFSLDFNIELYRKKCRYCEFAGDTQVCDAFI
ncbi:PD-(D/E)XK nuclease family protein [Clostridium estertheticum]|uniref:PD-(D/E)XK nuclease family protein n=1 Tax=Clostridium estertheticum TaxID=238834 RepID=UPI001C6EBBAA|nr:PD-(D/E)XK nuclease family protein [Clostridium estertheticum]MBW9172451.1 PD-(D/E)XK nuclease family protein [Clostridium estertheticum]WLC73477.1 PD-(D/E)XK nuclease family protein [Clostridium estertheticum]